MPYKKHHQVEIYYEPGSKLCELVKTYFMSNGIDYMEYNVKVDDNARQKMAEISEQEKVPVVEIDGRVIVGYQPDLYDIVLFGASE